MRDWWVIGIEKQRLLVVDRKTGQKGTAPGQRHEMEQAAMGEPFFYAGNPDRIILQEAKPPEKPPECSVTLASLAERLEPFAEHNGRRLNERRLSRRTGVACPKCQKELLWKSGEHTRAQEWVQSVALPAVCGACGYGVELEL